MKNLKKLFVAFIAMVTTISCGDPELPVELFPEMQYGAYARKMSQEGKFNFYDIAGSSVDMHVEYYDEAQGANIAEFDIDVEYVDVVGGGAGSIARTNFRTISASEFQVNSDGYLSNDISLGFTATLAAVGATESDITGGNYFRYWFTITKTDGTVYDYNNTGPNMQSSNAFGALFRLNVCIKQLKIQSSGCLKDKMNFALGKILKIRPISIILKGSLSISILFSIFLIFICFTNSF